MPTSIDFAPDRIIPVSAKTSPYAGLLSLKNYAGSVGLSLSSGDLEDLARDHLIPAVKIGGQWMVNQNALSAYRDYRCARAKYLRGGLKRGHR